MAKGVVKQARTDNGTRSMRNRASRSFTTRGAGVQPRAGVPSLEECYPASTKEFDTIAFNGHALHVPKRRVHLQEGAPSPGYFDLYDTSGPQGVRAFFTLGTCALER